MERRMFESVLGLFARFQYWHFNKCLVSFVSFKKTKVNHSTKALKKFKVKLKQDKGSIEKIERKTNSD